MFERLRSACLKLRIEKCQFVRKEVKYLGHVVSSEGVKTDPDKVEKIQNRPRPKSISDVRSFVNFASYYHRFVQDFAAIAEPLTSLTQKNAPFQWTPETEASFTTPKRTLSDGPVLVYPQFDKPFFLKTDASGVGLGVVLSQIVDGSERPVAFASRQLFKAERNYCATDKELLAIVWGIEHFRVYFYGRRFVVITRPPTTGVPSVK